MVAEIEKEKYWELYDDQTEADFTQVCFVDLSGNTVLLDITGRLVDMVKEIRRTNGRDTLIKVMR